MRHVSQPAARPRLPPDDPELLAQGTDSLTGLLTRDAFLQVLDRRTAESLYPGQRFALLAMAFDRDAGSADGPGRPIGEALRQAIARRLRGDIRSADLAARLDENGFAILLPAPSAEADAQGLAARLLEMMAQPFLLEGRAVTLACRIGIAVFPTDSWEATGLLRSMALALDAARAGQEDGTRIALPRRTRPRAEWDGRVL